MPFSAEPLSSHLGDYVADLEKRNRAGRKGRGARKVKMRVTTLLKECNWQFAYNIQRGLVHQLEKPASEVCSDAQPSSASDGFVLNWLERSGRIKGNPLKFIGKIDERGQSKRVLRDFNDDDLQRLVAGSGARGLIYFTAARTGLRQEELRQLVWEDLRLDDAVPQVRVRVVCAKNKKEERVPLVPEIAKALRAHRLPDHLPGELVFPNGIPRAAQLQRDLERNGIAYQDGSGRYADFHAPRYTWATFLHRHGVQPRLAMKLLRHSHISLTTRVYTDESQLPIYDAVKALPRLVEHTQIRAQISGAAGQRLSRAGAASKGQERGVTPGKKKLFVLLRRCLSQRGTNSG
jgi:integrase